MSQRHFDFWPPGAPRTITAPATYLFHDTDVSATRHVTRRFDVSFDRELSFAGFEQAAEQLASYLQRDSGDSGASAAIQPFSFDTVVAWADANRVKAQCLGTIVFNTDARVIDPDTLQELTQGEVGEVISHGPQVFAGYWRNPAATEAEFIRLDDQKYFRTGDLGDVDADGCFFRVDRFEHMINAAGFKGWPAEVEAQMYRHPAIQEGLRDRSQGCASWRDVKAAVVLRDTHRGRVTDREIIEWKRQSMAAYKHPRVIESVDAASSRLPARCSGDCSRRRNWHALEQRE